MTHKNSSIFTANQIRSAFLNYFHEHQHEWVPSSSLVPHNDPTLLFVNAGMVQFKDVFLGREERTYQRATSSQRCIRAGGKHNDLERVGYTARHHTFFEMLGNFSFGDYFKREAIQFAWQFLTDVLKLPPHKLWITVFKNDEEAANIWLAEMKIDPTRFSRLGEDSNFWSMGPTGPCGPCTEIFYDHGAHIPGGPPGSPDEDGDRYVEIWNLVFMQYDRAADGALTPLPKPSVDTGMGLERIAAVIQGVQNNYDIDLFQHLIKKIAQLAKTQDLTQTSLRVIADHIRATAFLIADRIIPSNEGRGYVLRRIMRRAIRHGYQLGLKEPFFYKLVPTLVEQMGEAYPELTEAANHIEKTILQEEQQFSITLSQGLKLFSDMIKNLNGTVIPGETVFKLYDTFGFPVDLTADMAREYHLVLDLEGFETAMTEQRERSRQASQFTSSYQIGANLESATEFVGHKNLLTETSPDTGKILALYKGQEAVDLLPANTEGSIILDRTPFYAEAGGQIGDQGILQTADAIFRVQDTKKQGQLHVHMGKLEKGELKVGETVFAIVDAKRRAATVLNHTATHLLHFVLRQVLGTHVIQKGSLVEPARLRFDFSHPNALSAEEIQKIEERVNEEIRANHESIVRLSSPKEAIASGAMALFEEKYGKEVRVVSFGESVELCGGTHAHHTGDVGLFKITGESGIAAGIRRLEAVTGEGALKWLEMRENQHREEAYKAEEQIRSLEKELSQLKEKLAVFSADNLTTKVKEINGINVLTAKLEGVEPKSLRTMVDQLKNKLGSAVITLAVVKDGKVSVVVGVTKNYIDKIKAGELVNMIAKQLGGKGGGRPDMAEAGGNQPEHLDQALNSIEEWIKDK